MADSRNLLVWSNNLLGVAAPSALSTTSHSPTLGTKVFTLGSSPRIYKRMVVRFSRQTDAAVFVQGPVTAWNPITRQVEIDAQLVGGAGGPYTNWAMQARKVWGGDWVENGSIGLANLATDRLWQFARSTDADPDSTQFFADLGSAAQVDAIIPFGVNSGMLGQVRHRLVDIDPFSGLETLRYDALLDLWPEDLVYGEPNWGDDDLWFLRRSTGDRRLPQPHLLREQLALDSASAVAIGLGVKQFVMLGSTDGFAAGMRCTASSRADFKKSMAGEIQAVGPTSIDLRVDWPEGSGAPDDWTLRAMKPGGERIAVTAGLAHVRLYDPGNSKGYLQIAHLIVDRSYQFQNNFSYGRAHTPVDRSVQAEAYGGQIYTSPRAGYRQVDIELGFMSEAEALGIVDPMKRRLGISKPAFWMATPHTQDYSGENSIFGSLVGPLSPSVEFAFKRWRTGLRIREWNV